MEAVAASEPFSADDYVFEVKWEGLRALLFVDAGGRARLQNRALEDVTDLVPEIRGAADQVTPQSVLDGEIVAIDAEGRPDRARLAQRLARRLSAEEAPLVYVAFDALFCGGRSLLRQPLRKRKPRLHRAVRSGHHLFCPDHIEREGTELFEACLERGLEGVVAKHAGSTYVPGQRSPFWLAVEAVKHDNFVVLGATPGDPFGALLVGYHEEGQLLPCGSLTGGFDDDEVAALAEALRRLAQERCPLTPTPLVAAPVQWVRPELVVSVRYSEWAPDGTLRFPIFDGVRRDVHPTECVRRRPRVVPAHPPRAGTAAYDLTRFPF
jgi:DNA ligase D-like protein (predicted ligase)